MSAAQKTAILAQVGHFYFGAVGQFYVGANSQAGEVERERAARSIGVERLTFTLAACQRTYMAPQQLRGLNYCFRK